MGLAASQARLLTITARLADNELRSQTINNAKMRLATQSSQASDEYISALNNAQLMFSNTDINGLARKQSLTYNNLVAYSQYNNQYGLVNSAGLLLVSEQDARNYENCGGDLDKFLEEYGLEWETTFFDSIDDYNPATGSGGLQSSLVQFYGNGYDSRTNKYDLGVLFEGLSNEQLKRIYEEAQTDQATIERLNYDIYAKEYYQELKTMYDNTITIFRNNIIGDSNSMDEDDITGILAAQGASKDPGKGDQYIKDLLLGIIGGKGGVSLNDYPDKNKDGQINNDDMSYCYNNIKNNLTKNAQNILENMIDSLTDKTDGSNLSGFMDKRLSYSSLELATDKYYAVNENGNRNYTLNPDGTHDYDYNFTDSTDNDVYIEKESSEEYYKIKIAGITVKIDAPVLANDGTVTWQTGGETTWQHNTTGEIVTTKYGKTPSPKSDYTKVSDNFSTDSQNVQKETGSRATFVDETTFNNDGEGGEYNRSVLDALNSYLRDKTISDFQGTQLKTTLDEFTKLLSSQRVHSDGENDPCIYRYNKDKDTIYRVPIIYSTRKETYEALIDNYLNSILNVETFFDPSSMDSSNETLKDALENFSMYDNNPVYGSPGNGNLIDKMKENNSFLMNFTAFLENVGNGIGTIGSYNYGSEAFHSVITTYLCELMTDVLGEPKYAWVDKNNPDGSQNADAKAQWYENLFNRMQRGYKVLESGLANSKEWIEYAFESGLVTMEQVDKSYNWIALDYKTCSNIYEESDTSDLVAKAEAKYNRAMNDVKQKDNMYDLQLKNIDTEHQSLQTEYDSVKGVINKNLERTMKFDQSA